MASYSVDFDATKIVSLIIFLVAGVLAYFFFKGTATDILSFFNPVILLVGVGAGLLIVWVLTGRQGRIVAYIGAVLLIIGLLSYLVSGELTDNLSGRTERFVCTGTIEVDFLGFGDPSLDPKPVCVVDECGYLPQTFAFWDFKDFGTLEFVSEGKVIASEGYESFNNNRNFQVTTSCVAPGSDLTINLYEDGVLVDTEVMIQ